MYRVVLVDDDPTFTEGFKNLIDWESYGFSIETTFTNAKEALGYLSNHVVELVITDIRMPFMDGLGFMKELRRQQNDVFIVVLSGFSDFCYAQQAIRYEAKGYLLKPINSDALTLLLLDLRDKLDVKYDANVKIAQSVGYYTSLVESIKKNVLRNYATVSLNSVAIDEKMSPNYISRIFKQYAGQNFSEYLLEVKMKQALKLLSGNTMKIYEVAYAVGYDNPKNFTRAFKKYWGKSPWEYKEGGFTK